jgi:hypothetical protein
VRFAPLERMTCWPFNDHVWRCTLIAVLHCQMGFRKMYLWIVRIPNCSEASTSGPMDWDNAPVAAARTNKADAKPFIFNDQESVEK